jgi:hypothetical protein
MRKLIVSNLMSLDGFFEGPKKELDWFVLDEEFFAYSREMLRSVDTFKASRRRLTLKLQKLQGARFGSGCALLRDGPGTKSAKSRIAIMMTRSDT